MEHLSGIWFSIFSGIFAAFAGFFGKVTFDSEVIDSISTLLDFKYHRILQAILGLCLVGCNICMLQNFNKALQQSRNTIQASIINTAANFIFTALIGLAAFDEPLSLLWSTGTALIIIGTYLISSETKSLKEE